MSHSPRIEGTKAVNVLRVASAGQGAQTVTIGSEVYELTTKDSLAVTAGRIPVDVHAGSTVKSRGRITFSDLPLDGETVTIGGKAYTFQTVLTEVDGHVLIGDTVEEMVDNLVAAVNLGSGAGLKYALLTTAHTTVTAIKSGTTKVLPQAIAGGTAGDAITLAEAATNVTKDSTTLGTEQAGVDPTASEVLSALKAAINAHSAQRIEAEKISTTHLLVRAKKAQVLALACTETLTGANNAWAAAAMYGGSVTTRRRMAIKSRVPLQVEVDVDKMHFELDFTPSLVIPWIYPTATPGAHKHWNGGLTIDGSHVTLDNGSSVDWATTDTVEVLFLE